MLRPIPLRQRLNDNGPGRHINSQGQSFRRVHHLDQAAGEDLFDGLLEQWEHSRVVCRHPAFEGARPMRNTEDSEIFGRD